MKKYSQEEYDALPVIDGYKECPTGDYTAIKYFGEYCRFSERCRFDKYCRFSECCRFSERCKIEGVYTLIRLLQFGGFGSEQRTTYIYLTDQGIMVRCGCFFGSLEQFRAKVAETHGDNHFAQVYLKLADLAEWELREGATS